jgi:hypothetical protein
VFSVSALAPTGSGWQVLLRFFARHSFTQSVFCEGPLACPDPVGVTRHFYEIMFTCKFFRICSYANSLQVRKTKNLQKC